MRFPQIIKSLIDSDLYKITMMAAVAQLFPRKKVKYQFINRGKTPFPEGFAAELREQVGAMSNIRLTPEEKEFLQKKCWYLPPTFLDLLEGYRYNPSEVGIIQNGGDLIITIEGYWYKTILWEVPLMALISELYFKMTHPEGIAKQRRELEKKNLGKAQEFAKNLVKVADFGTRRRYSFENQLNVCKDLLSFHNSKSFFVGTSNPLIAMMLDIPALGTHAHEWVSGIAAMKGYAHANREMMDAWMSVYEGDLGTALTDTFGVDAFLNDFTTLYAKLFDSVRHDSGDPYKFVDKMVAHYKKLRIDPMSKTIIFSDGLTIELSIKLAEYCEGKIMCSFGIGTHLTNDVGVKPLNIVIKMIMIDGMHVIKLSEDHAKAVGDEETIAHAKFVNGIKDETPEAVIDPRQGISAAERSMEPYYERQRNCEHVWQRGQGGTFCNKCGVLD